MGPIRFCNVVKRDKITYVMWDLHLKESILHRLNNHRGYIAATEHMGFLAYVRCFTLNFINFVFPAK